MKRIAAVMSLVLAGCAYEPVLVPDRSARSPDGRVAFTEVQGVEVVVNVESWASDPLDLPDVLAPVHVSIHNRSSVPLRLAYRASTTTASTSRRTTAPTTRATRCGRSGGRTTGTARTTGRAGCRPKT